MAIVVAGSAEATQSEGYDRHTLALPGRPGELVRRVAAACPRTVMVVNAGMPVQPGRSSPGLRLPVAVRSGGAVPARVHSQDGATSSTS